MINKTDLAPYVGVDVARNGGDATAARAERPGAGAVLNRRRICCGTEELGVQSVAVAPRGSAYTDRSGPHGPAFALA